MATLEEIQKAGGNFTPLPKITATALNSGTQPATVTPTATDTTPYSTIANGAVSSVMGDFTNLQNQQQTQEQTQTTSAQSQIDLMGLLSGRTADTQVAQEQAGVNTATTQQNEYIQQLANLNSQASSLQREAQAIPIQDQQNATGQGVTDRGLAPITTARLRENALKALSIGQQSDIASAALTGSTIRLNQAKEKAQQIVDLKYKPIEDALAREKELYTLNKDLLDRTDKRRSEALALAIKKDEEATAERKASEKTIEKLMIDASSVAPADVLQRAKDIQAKGGSATQVAMALGQYGGDYYKTALLKEQIETQKSARETDAAQRAKIYSDMAVTQSTQSKAEADSWVANIASGKAKLSDVPAKLKSLVSLGLSKTSISSPETKSKIEASQSVYDLAQELLTAEGKGGAVGAGLGKAFGAVIPGYDGSAFAGSDRATYEAKFSQLKDTLASSNLDKLKGAMSDKDIEFLRNIGTALKLEMPESAFDAELKKVQKVMINVPGVRVAPTVNKFNQALGQSTTPIAGSSIVNKVGDDGSVEFNIPSN